MKNDPVAGPFITPALTRVPALTRDLRYLLGDKWRAKVRPLPSTSHYVHRIDTVAATWNAGFVAHHYTRYLGDLSDGHIIRTLMQRQFGFDTDGVGFYLFDQIGDPRRSKRSTGRAWMRWAGARRTAGASSTRFCSPTGTPPRCWKNSSPSRSPRADPFHAGRAGYARHRSGRNTRDRLGQRHEPAHVLVHDDVARPQRHG